MARRKKKVLYPTERQFNNLLFMAHNIGPGVEPGTTTGLNMTNGAMDASRQIYQMLNNSKAGYARGVIVALRLFVETTCARDPVGYTERETRRADRGIRVMDDNAGIKLPVNED